MAIADKLTKLATDITNAYDAIDDKGGTLPSDKNTDNLENAIRSIQTGHLDNEEYETSNEKLDEILEGTEVPTGTKQISITQNGTTTEDVTNYANAQITTNVVNQDYEDALVAFGVTEELADGIEALTTYSNEVTGESDTTLSNAVRTLANGYGQGDGGNGYGSEFEQGIFTATENELPKISFKNIHNTPPSIILLQDVSDTFPAVGNTGLFFAYLDNTAVFGKAFSNTSSSTWDSMYLYGRASTALTYTSGSAQYTRGNVKSNLFEPFFGTGAMLCRTGQTYKWIAIWL